MNLAANSHDALTRVLLVEDNPGDAELVSSQLQDRRPDLEVVHVERLAPALEALRRNGFDAVLLDLGLPDSRGVASVERVIEARSNIPVIVLTGLDDDRAGSLAVQAGAQDFLTKGDYSSDSLLRSLNYAVERSRWQSRARELERRLLHADRLVAVGELVAGVAHETSTPSMCVQLNLEQLERDIANVGEIVGDLREQLGAQLGPGASSAINRFYATSELPSLLASMKEQVADCLVGMLSVAETLKGLSMFTRGGSDDIELVDLRGVVEEACSIAIHEIRRRARLVQKLEDVPAMAGERHRLMQVVVNLLVNAAQAVEPGSEGHNCITVETYARGGSIVVAVEDTGLGIAASDLRRVFEPFFTTKTRDGTGLGLAISAETVRKHGGEMRVESQVGVGTRFEMVFPRDTGLELAGKTPDVTETTSPQGLRILLIDDSDALRRALVRLLRRHHSVVEAACADDALRIIETDDSFDVVICDVMMPGLDGLAFLEMLQEKHPRLSDRFVFLTGGGLPLDARTAAGMKPPVVLRKPIDSATLDEVLASFRR